MVNPSIGPLSEADYKKINSALAKLEQTRVEIEKALEAGIPCQEQDAACKAVRDQLVQIKKVYFPSRP